MRFAITLICALAVLLTVRSAYADDAGYTYPGRTDNGFKSATLTMTSATVPAMRGHVAVWLGAQDYIGHWLQAGIIEGHGQSFPCVYVETKTPTMPFVRQCIRSYPPLRVTSGVWPTTRRRSGSIWRRSVQPCPRATFRSSRSPI